jgi:hypothetical protein
MVLIIKDLELLTIRYQFLIEGLCLLSSHLVLPNLASILADNNTIHTTLVATQALDNHSYDGFGKQQICNTARDAFEYKSEESINTIKDVERIT